MFNYANEWEALNDVLRLKWNVKGSNYRPEELLLWAMQNSENT
jgi:hypothetical protein